MQKSKKSTTQNGQSDKKQPIGTPRAVQYLDHQTLGPRLQLFKTTEYSPGSPFFLPKGTAIINKLIDFLRAQYIHYGYEEVITPLLYKKSLWEKSGHWAQYKDDMFTLSCQHHSSSSSSSSAPSSSSSPDDTFGLKPMNCPGHCLIYALNPRSYKDLPLRLADFSSLHRNEPSGSLSGLTRVRRFHQDDAHIFCRPDQIGSEVLTTLEFVLGTYKTFHLPAPQLVLSTRPETGFIGTLEEWDSAEEALRRVLTEAVGKGGWALNEGDGAFYGPKIDIRMPDRAGKQFQIGTVQLDLQLPQRFDLQYVPHTADIVTTATTPILDPDAGTDADSGAQDSSPAIHRPVMIHRAAFGSLERFLALLIEHYQTRWPLWLSPNPVIVLPVHSKTPQLLAYAEHVRAVLQTGLLNRTGSEHDGGTKAGAGGAEARLRAMRTRRVPLVRVDLDAGLGSLAAKVARAAAAEYNLKVLVGDKEMETQTVMLDFTCQLRGLDGMEEPRVKDQVDEAGGTWRDAERTVTKDGRRQMRLPLAQLQGLVMELLHEKL